MNLVKIIHNFSQSKFRKFSTIKSKHYKSTYKKINYINIGLVQVAIKPLFHLGLNIHVFICLRDARSTKFTDSILNMIDSNLTNGPVYFNHYPNFSMNINDPSILLSLALNINKIFIYEFCKRNSNHNNNL